MTSKFDAHAYVDAVAPAMSLTIAAESRDAVAENLKRLELLARQVMSYEVAASVAPGSGDEG